MRHEPSAINLLIYAGDSGDRSNTLWRNCKHTAQSVELIESLVIEGVGGGMRTLNTVKGQWYDGLSIVRGCRSALQKGITIAEREKYINLNPLYSLRSHLSFSHKINNNRREIICAFLKLVSSASGARVAEWTLAAVVSQGKKKN